MGKVMPPKFLGRFLSRDLNCAKRLEVKGAGIFKGIMGTRLS
jgi:hypothetical protein